MFRVSFVNLQRRIAWIRTKKWCCFMQKGCFLVLTYNRGYGSKETVIQKVRDLTGS